MIQITINDPAKTPRAQLDITIALLQAFRDGERALNALAAKLANSATDAAAPLPPVVLIADDDRPDAGADIVNPADAFGSASANEAFGAPTTHGSAALDADATKLNALAGPGAAGVTLAALGNVPGAGNAGTSAPMSLSAPPAAPNAPSVAAAPATAGTGQVETDTDGLPHDPRIHASTRGKNADGRWKAKRGVEPALVQQVQAELRQLMAIPSPAAAPNVAPPPPPPVATGAPVTPPPPPVMIPPPSPVPPVGTAAPAPVTTPAAPAGVDFATLAALVGQMIAAGRLTQDKLTEIVGSFGLPNFGLMFNRPDLVPGVHAAIKAAIGEA